MAVLRMGSAAYDAHGESLHAAHRAIKEADPTHGSKHFYLYDGIHGVPDWVAKGERTASYGPFKNISGGGDATRGRNVKIMIIR